jgi:hypothetical protein
MTSSTSSRRPESDWGKRCGRSRNNLKTSDTVAESKIESIRYRFYDFERQIALTLRPAACGFANVRLLRP